MSIWNVTDARAALPEILRQVEEGEDVSLTRHGRVVAVVVRPDSLPARRASAAARGGEAIEQLLRELVGQNDPDGGLSNGGSSISRAEELIASVRNDRDRT